MRRRVRKSLHDPDTNQCRVRTSNGVDPLGACPVRGTQFDKENLIFGVVEMGMQRSPESHELARGKVALKQRELQPVTEIHQSPMDPRTPLVAGDVVTDDES